MKMKRVAWAVVPAILIAMGVGYSLQQWWLPNLRCVRTGVLWRSGQPSLVGLWVARLAGTRTIISLRAGNDERSLAEAAFAERHGIRLIREPLQFSGRGTEGVARRVLEVLADSQAWPVLVHCARGKERSGLIAAVFRIECDGWTNSQALEEMHALGLRPGSLPGFESFIASYVPQGRGKERRAHLPGVPLAEPELAAGW